MGRALLVLILGIDDPALERGLRQALPVTSSVDLTRETALSYLRNKGYLEADVDASSTTLSVRLGPVYTFGATRIDGLRKYPEDRLRLDLPYAEGARYERGRLLEAQRRLFGLGLFEDVRITASTTTARRADVLVRVKERPMKWVRSGAGYGSEEKERLSLILTHNNLFRRGYKIEAAAQYSKIWLDLRAGFVNRHLFGSIVEQRFDASWRRENRRGFDFERTLGQLGLARPLPWSSRVEARYKLQQAVLYNVAPGVAVDQATSRPASSGVGVTLSRDSTNDLFYPSDGTRAAVLLERAGGALGGTVDFNRGSIAASGYRTLFGPVVGVLAGAFGVVREFRPSRAVPIYERFFVGGGASVRGYRERDIGPKSETGDPLGGSVLARGNLEVRFPIWRRLSGAVFIDAGQVHAYPRGVSPRLWKAGAGPGLRVATPIGPLRLDFGYKVNPDPGDRSLWAIHFSLGESF